MVEIFNQFSLVFSQSIKIAFFALVIASPFLLGFLFFSTWLRYIRTRYIFKQEYVLLEIKMPREIIKSPVAMEIFLMSLYQTGAVTYTDTYILGKIKPWFSLEIISQGGEVRFFIWAQAKYKNLIETQIYAQYQDVEIYEANDYTTAVKHDPKNMIMWGTYYGLKEKDVYPIKTYIDYGLEKETKEEEYKVDPFASVIEYLGSMKEGEQVWIQILIQAHKKEGLREGRLFKKQNWKNEAQKEIQKIQADMMLDSAHMRMMTEMEKEKITAIERSLGKFAFDCMMRAFYISKKESFNEIAIPGLIGSIRQYNSNNLNGFQLGLYTDHTDNEKDWINIGSIFFPPLNKMMDKRRSKLEYQMLEAYKMRSFFQPPYKNYRTKPFILTTEELATIYHFPGKIASTPTLSRIGSRKAKPPPNLPV